MNNGQKTDGVDGKYVPPKNWAEISDSEKIERTREIIKGLERQVGSLRIENNKLWSLVEKHYHLDGKIVTQFNRYDGNFPVCGDFGSSLRSNGGGVYF